MKKTIYIGIIIIIWIIIICGKVYIEKNNKFTEEDWQYMYNYIDEKYGNGEHFHIISKKTDKIKKNQRTRIGRKGTSHYEYETLGIQASFIGYFDSQDELYSIVFSKYLKDQRYLKDGKAGKVICTTINTNRSKEEYFKGTENQ